MKEFDSMQDIVKGMVAKHAEKEAQYLPEKARREQMVRHVVNEAEKKYGRPMTPKLSKEMISAKVTALEELDW